MWVIVVNTKSACNSKLGANFQCGSLNAFRPSIGYHKMHIGGHQEQRHDRRQVQRYQSQWWISSSWYTQNNSQGNAPISPTSFFLWISICGSVPIFLYVSNARVLKKKKLKNLCFGTVWASFYAILFIGYWFVLDCLWGLM